MERNSKIIYMRMIAKLFNVVPFHSIHRMEICPMAGACSGVVWFIASQILTRVDRSFTGSPPVCKVNKARMLV